VDNKLTDKELRALVDYFELLIEIDRDNTQLAKVSPN